MSFPVLIPAAGASRRFGPANKLLAEFRGRPVLAWVIRAAQAAGAGRVLVVTGHEGEAVAALVRAEGAEPVANAAHAEGMGASIAAGVRTLPQDAPGVFVVPGDMPLVPPTAFAALLRAGAGEADILRPALAGRPGHPVWFGRRFLPGLARLSGDRGAAGVIAAHPGALRIVPVDDPGVLLDLDTPEALAAAQATPT